jgi:hypothetical protein
MIKNTKTKSAKIKKIVPQSTYNGPRGGTFSLSRDPKTNQFKRKYQRQKKKQEYCPTPDIDVNATFDEEEEEHNA